MLTQAIPFPAPAHGLRHCVLPDRAVLRVHGKDATSFLQGLVTNDIGKASPEKAILAALLTPQGKFLADFFIIRQGEGFLLDTEKATLESLLAALARYRLRAAAAFDLEPGLTVAAWPGAAGAAVSRAAAEARAVCFADPRLPALGARTLATQAQLAGMARALDSTPGAPETYEALRLEHGVPEGAKDAVPGQSLLLENGYDRLGGIDFGKGCYVGQEVTARTRHRATLRKRLYRILGEAALPAPGTEIAAGGRRLGEMRSSCGKTGLGLIHVEDWEKAKDQAIAAGGVPIRIEIPFWHERL